MNDSGIDPSFVHQGDGLRRGEGRHLAMRKIAGQPLSPQVNLGVDDFHHALRRLLALLVQPAANEIASLRARCQLRGERIDPCGPNGG